ncbi:uncharacterized protein Ecym_8424 [Eremothecium cymbalariae DBVPG|uniref:acid phosphatase n=1 Tax=Eremothecium cymbalariae (strain CBS 270.75 / DBVPG 7215 / KCTC 17166 / NRRL Y-17582) TaxID=931890 RepID=G8JXW9_ERECY|nr:Hypothetical protein Ecym_8424 [Eremothecium cymbalariae DBVPG\
MKFSKVIYGAAIIEGIASGVEGKKSSNRQGIRKYDKISPSLAEIRADAAVAKTNTDTSSVEGKGFNRFLVIWLENTDFDKAAGDSNMKWLGEHGITLNNYWALTHPSMPNYLASVGGDYFAVDDDRFIRVPENVSTVVDLLDTKGISWSEYQEHQPYTGFQGFNYSNQETFASDYVRKHNPLVLYDSIVNDDDRLANLKNFTQFYKDLEDEKLPQYAIITPNMTNDGHDTTIKFAADWSRSFLEPLLSNEYFMRDTLVLLTFDENDTYTSANRVFSILLGGAVPEHLKGTTDDTYYDHYSQLSSIEANWDLPHLGRHDVDANVFQFVADKIGVTNVDVETTYKYNNYTYIGYFNDVNIEFPAPNVTAINKNGKGILDSIKEVWEKEYEKQVAGSYFTSTTTTVTPSSHSTADIIVPVETVLSQTADYNNAKDASSSVTSSSVTVFSVANSPAGAAFQLLPGMPFSVQLLFTLLIGFVV